MERLNRKFRKPSSRAARAGAASFDLGILNYHPQIWASDNMDGLDRLLIQYGTSFCYPPVSQGSHIGASPNPITKRVTPLKWRALVAMSANMGVEADISKWSEEERKELAGYIALYKEIRPLVQFGDFHRLEAPYGSPRAAWMFTSSNQKDALLFVFPNQPAPGPGDKTHPPEGIGPGLDLRNPRGGTAVHRGKVNDGRLAAEWVPARFHPRAFPLRPIPLIRKDLALFGKPFSRNRTPEKSIKVIGIIWVGKRAQEEK